MCDTFFIPASKSATGYPILAKNSDREPNEMQHIVKLAHRTAQDHYVKATFITVPHTRERNAVILSKPFHMWGAEMGINEHGLAIGNEAVFTNIPIPKKNDGLTGMDMIRLALESCTTAAEARDKICAWVASPGQDSCGGYMDRNFFYHNSFMIADPVDAFVIETAGPHWAWKKLTGFHAISNRLSLGTDHDEASDQARGKDFAATFSAPFMSRMAKGRERKALCTNNAAAIIAQRPFMIEDAFAVLRSHHHEDGFLPHRAGMDNICLHATGPLTPSQTTGSMVMELRPKGRPQIWATGSSAPCLSLFKPLFFGDLLIDENHWTIWEQWHRRALCHYTQAKALWHSELLPLERTWIEQWDKLDDEDAAAFSAKCFSESTNRLPAIMEQLPRGSYPGLLYRWHWKRQDRQVQKTE